MNAAVYVRKSTEQTGISDDQRSVARQIEHANAYAQRKGWTVDDATWADAIARALAAPHIVQERVRIPYEPYPSLADGTVQIMDRMLDTAPFVSYGEYMEGYLTRLSTAALLNVTAGGGSSVPSFLVTKR